MCHDMCKCFGRVGENREGMETGDAGREGGDAAICVALVKGETQIAVDIGKRTFISIHAPAKGATPQRPRRQVGQPISIHAPVKGATQARSSGKAAGNISIHAPAKGATHHNNSVKQRLHISIHAPAKGAT